MLVAMAKEVAPADMLMMSMLIATLVVGIIDIDEVVQGFSNTGMLTVAMLLVVAEAMQKTGAINGIKTLLGKKGDAPQKLGIVLMRIMVPVTVLSVRTVPVQLVWTYVVPFPFWGVDSRHCCHCAERLGQGPLLLGMGGVFYVSST